MIEPKITNAKDYKSSVSFKTAIFIIAIDQTPPHIGLVVNDKYYSYSARGTILGIPLERQIVKINRLKLASALVEVNIELDIEFVKSIFKELSVAEIGESCFLPLIDIFRKEVSIPLECKFIYQFIPYMYSINKIEDIYQLNAKHLLDPLRSIELNIYGQQEIDNAINKSRKHAKV